MHKSEQLMNTYLHRISNILLINGGYLANPGLYSGEMGLVLFFYRYARLTQNEIYAEYGSVLLEKIQNKIHPNTSVNYKQGLSGIGSAIEYLTQNGYLNIDTDVVLEEMDKRIFFTFNLPYLPIDKIADIGYYALWRLSGNSAQKDIILKSVMPQIVHVMEEWQMNQNTINPAVSFFRDIILKKKQDSLHGQLIISSWLQLCRENNLNNSGNTKPFTHLLEYFSDNDSTTNNVFDLGFQNGLAGLGLFFISELDCDDSWYSLYPNNIIPYEK
jgi:hypothetical protein